jgi:serine/threonine protein kinase
MEQDADEILYGLVMEYFDDFQEIDMKKADIHLAEVLGKTLERIHEGGVIHNDIEERNILLVREAGSVRIVWIDFSCAWTGIQFKGTRRLEWDMFCGFLFDNMVPFPSLLASIVNVFQDPNIISDEVLDEKFPRKPLESSTPPPNVGVHPPPQAESLAAAGSIPRLLPPTYLRMAYATFFCAQLFVAIFMLGDVHVRKTVIYAHNIAALSSLGIFFLLARNESLSTKAGSGFAVVFLIHNVLSFCTTVYDHLEGFIDERVVLYRSFHLALMVLYLSWMICGLLAIRNLWLHNEHGSAFG